MSIIRNAVVLGVVGVVGVAGSSRAADAYKVSGAEVVVVCPLTVGGSFEARTKSVSGEVTASAADPGSVTGALKVDLQTLETGIAVRDRHMRDNYLEVEKGPDFAVATFDKIRVEKLAGKSTFKGTLLLHGQRQEVSGVADLQQRDGRIRVQAQFPIKVSAFQIPKPTYLGVGVRDEIQIKVMLTVEPSPDRVAASR
jgi:polyisoprenoid-binding protein YceI